MLDFISSLFKTGRVYGPLPRRRKLDRNSHLADIPSALATWAAFTTALVALNFFILRRKNGVPRAF